MGLVSKLAKTFKLMWLGPAILIVALPLARAEVPPEATAYKAWKVSSLEIQGLDDETAKAIAKGLELSGEPAFYPQILSDDMDRTLLYLARRGHPYASAAALFDPDHNRKRLKVTIEVEKGPPVVVSSVATSGIPDRLVPRARNLVYLEGGSVFADDVANRTAASLLGLLSDFGYARAEVIMEVAALDTVSVEVLFRAAPGPVNYFRDVAVENAPEDLVRLTERVAQIGVGSRFSPKAVNDARKSLRRLDLYRRINVDTLLVGDDSLDVAVDVSVGKYKTLKGAVRYWNDEGFRVSGDWRHRNLFRRGRGLNIGVMASTLRQRAEVSLWWLALIAPKTREMISLTTERQDEEAYEQVSYGADLSTTYYISFEDNVRLGVQVSNVDVIRKTSDSLVTDVQEGLLTEVYGRINQNNTDDPFNPSRGFASWLDVKWAPNGSISESHYIIGEGSGSAYVSGLERLIVAFRLGLGLGRPTGSSSEILVSRRLYSGGANSMRGFARRRLGPKDASGAPVGGEAKLEASVELRRPLLWKIWGTAFLDAGQVWSTLDDIDLARTEFAIGPGIWLMTPVGPLRFDVGYRLTFWDETEDRWAYHLSIGPAF
jgi:outer membrane protein insertion porin family